MLFYTLSLIKKKMIFGHLKKTNSTTRRVHRKPAIAVKQRVFITHLKNSRITNHIPLPKTPKMWSPHFPSSYIKLTVVMALINTTQAWSSPATSVAASTGRPFYRPEPKFALIRCSRAYVYTVHASLIRYRVRTQRDRDTYSCDDLYQEVGRVISFEFAWTLTMCLWAALAARNYHPRFITSSFRRCVF